MKPATVLALAFLAALAVCTAVPLSAQPATADAAGADLKAAQFNVQLANLQLALATAKDDVKTGQLPAARRELTKAQELISAVAGQTDVTAYRQVADKIAKDLERAQDTQRRLEVVKQYGQAPIPPEAFNRPEATDSAQEGYGNPKTTDPQQPNLDGQAALAAGQAALAANTNVANSPAEMTTDPAVVKQRTLDHQAMWDDGRYAPAKELIDVGKLLELDRERMFYHAAVEKVADASHADELQHVREAMAAPPAVMNYPADWAKIKDARKQYADGKLWESAPFIDPADKKVKTVAVYDISDLLFVPIFPGPSEYNVNRPINTLNYWTNQDRLRDQYTHPPYTWYGPGYNDAIYGGPVFAGQGGPVAAPAQMGRQGDGNPAPANPVAGVAGPVEGNRCGIGGYGGYRVTDIIPSVSYFPYEADPIYQYRLAMKRAQVLTMISEALKASEEKPGNAEGPGPGPR